MFQTVANDLIDNKQLNECTMHQAKTRLFDSVTVESEQQFSVFNPGLKFQFKRNKASEPSK
jgi:hypothetical protein